MKKNNGEKCLNGGEWAMCVAATYVCTVTALAQGTRGRIRTLIAVAT